MAEAAWFVVTIITLTRVYCIIVRSGKSFDRDIDTLIFKKQGTKSILNIILLFVEHSMLMGTGSGAGFAVFILKTEIIHNVCVKNTRIIWKTRVVVRKEDSTLERTRYKGASMCTIQFIE